MTKHAKSFVFLFLFFNEKIILLKCLVNYLQVWKTIPVYFRKYTRKMVEILHKKEDGEITQQSTEKTQAIPADITPDINQFLQQFLQQWHSKLASLPPHLVSKEMAGSEDFSLPQGLEKSHLEWLCCFLARWHHRHAGKCDLMAPWLSFETSDDTSEDESRPLMSNFGKF